jgi:hypothetical protein
MLHIPAFITKHKKIITSVFIAAAVVCLFGMLQVSVNYNMVNYLPKDSQSTIAIKIMDNEFSQAVPNARVMLSGVALTEALEYKEKIKAINGVTDVLWLDDVINLKEPVEMADQNLVREYYRDNTALYSVSIKEGAERSATDAIYELIGKSNALAGDAVNIATSQKLAASETTQAIIILAPIILLILLISTDSWLEPFLFLGSIGISVLLNMGTNVFFGEVSFMTQAISPILQLAVSLDYAIFLLHSFAEFRKQTEDVNKAMMQAMKRAFPAIAASAATTFTMPGNATTIAAAWTQNSSGGGGGGGHTQPSNNNTIVIVDNQNYSIGSENKKGSDTTATVDQSKLTDDIAKASDSSCVIFPVSSNTNITAQLVVKNIEDMAKKDMTLTVQTGKVSYNLNTAAIDTAKIAAALGMTDSNKIPFNVSISNSNAAVNGTTVVLSPVEFTITATYNGKTATVDKFSSFVDRTIEITADQAKKITTAVVLEPNGSLRHVPTRVTVIDGKYYAVINSLTNSIYSVIWHPVEFSDVTAHWAKATINDMGCRMVISGVGQGNFEPDRDITRAEFAAIVVRALGLAPGNGTSSFTDVSTSDWYCGYVKTAAEYGIITGYDAATFGPSDKITREQAMTMIARAMKITGLKSELKDSEIRDLIANYSDGSVTSDYAKTSIADCLKTGMVTGRTSDTIAPKDCITRAEVAVIVQRLLQKSDLI